VSRDKSSIAAQECHSSLPDAYKQESRDEWMNELEERQKKEIVAWKRRNYIKLKQEKIQRFYKSQPVHFVVAAMIMCNFFIEAFR
jgi:hypothetical protein